MRATGRTILLMAVMAYQAKRHWKGDNLVLPSGYRLVTVIGSRDYPKLGFVAQSKDRIVIALKGTEGMEELLKDLELVQIPYPYAYAGRTHKGFTDLYGRVVRPAVYRALKGLSAAKALYLTGHSLGAALATIGALDLAKASKFRNPRIYTFGSPRVGDPAFVSAFRKGVARSVRIANVNDWVVSYPPVSILGYTYDHVHETLEIRFNNISPLANHKMENYLLACCALSPEGYRTICTGRDGLCPL